MPVPPALVTRSAVSSMVSGRSRSERALRVVRPLTYTVGPAAPSSTAMPRPAPLVAPATRAIRPVNGDVMSAVVVMAFSSAKSHYNKRLFVYYSPLINGRSFTKQAWVWCVELDLCRGADPLLLRCSVAVRQARGEPHGGGEACRETRFRVRAPPAALAAPVCVPFVGLPPSASA